MQSSSQNSKKFFKSNQLQKENDFNLINNTSNINNDNLSFTRNSIKSETESLYKEEPIYRHLNMIFFRLFGDHDYSPEDKFDKNVWFLKNNAEFQKFMNSEFINKSGTPEGQNPSSGQSSELIKILQDCSFGGKNHKSLLVEVKRFVNEISKALFNAHQRKSNAEEMVKHYKMDEMKELILDKLMKEKSTLNFLSDITEIQFSISKLEGFPEGGYDSLLVCEAFHDSESPLIQTHHIKKTLLGSKKIVINAHNMDQKLSSPEFFELIDIRNEKNYEYLNLDEVNLSKSKFNEEASYIGLLLNSFTFIFSKENVYFASSESERLIDNFINNLDTLLKDKAFRCSSAGFAYVDSNNKNFVKAGLDNSKLVVYYDLEVNFNKKTKLLVLEKIYDVFYDTITTKFDNEKVINNILAYFYEVNRDVKDIFNEKKNVNMERCGPCNNCSVL